MRASIDQRAIFSCSSGMRVVTDLHGALRAVVGIQPEPQAVILNAGSDHWIATVSPNQVIGLGGSTPRLLRAAPFDYPYA